SATSSKFARRTIGSWTGISTFFNDMFGMLCHLLLKQIACGFARSVLRIAISAVAGHGLIEIDQMSVKIRSVHASELHLSAYAEPAAAAHAGTVDHDRIHAHDRLDPIFLGEQADELHHRQRTDGDDFVKLLSLFDQFFQYVGDQSLYTGAAIVAHQVAMFAYGVKLFFQNDEVLVPEA